MFEPATTGAESNRFARLLCREPWRVCTPRALGPWAGVALLALLVGCGPAVQPVVAPVPGNAPSASPAASESPDAAAPLPQLRTGPLTPLSHAQIIDAELIKRQLTADAELLSVRIPLPHPLVARPVAVALDHPDSQPAPLAFVPELSYTQPRQPEAFVWIRRSRAAAGTAVEGHLYSAADDGHDHARPGEHFRFRIASTANGAADPKLQQAWAEQLAAVLTRGRWRPDLGTSPWHEFAAARVLQVFGNRAKQAAPGARPSRTFTGDGELSRLMDTTTGMTSIQETLQTNRTLLQTAVRQARTVAITAAKPPTLEQHPFKRMRLALGQMVPAEPLARAAPAEFYYVRFRSLSALFQVLDELDAWGAPGARALDGRSSDHGLSGRYEAQLGLGRGPLTRALGPEVIDSLALVGSDPYVREGTDLTAIFRVKSHGAFRAGLAASLAKHADHHGALRRSTEQHGQVAIAVARSDDGAVRQHRATMGDLAIVSNSPAAIRRVLDAIAGQRPRLIDEPDFQYMLTRDAKVRDDVLGFAGDRFVAAVVGPAQKILEARRQLALAELSTPGYAAMLYGWIHGRSPASVVELVRSKLLERSELRHGGGEAISWQPGGRAKSSWGSPGALTPLIDRPVPKRITVAEQEGYRRFAEGYQQNWSTYIDPILLKLALQGGPKTASRAIEAHLRVLPLIDATEYDEIAQTVGRARIGAAPVGDGVRIALGLGREAKVRRELSKLASEFVPGGRRFDVDWIGKWAMLGVADRPSLAHALRRLAREELPERPYTEDEEPPEREHLLGGFRHMPLFAAIDLRSTAAASLALVAVRKVADSTLPGMVQWGEHESYRDVPVVRVAVREQERRRGRDDREGAPEHDIEIFYAICEGALLVALQHDVLRGVIDGQLDGTGVQRQGQNPEFPQLLSELAGDRSGALWTVLGWMLEQQGREAVPQSRASAEVVLRGAPELRKQAARLAQLHRATLGYLPVTPDGRSYELRPSGVADPVRGTPHAPSWPALPVAGSPADQLLSTLARFRSEIAFDEEGKDPSGKPMRSLRVQLTLGLRR